MYHYSAIFQACLILDLINITGRNFSFPSTQARLAATEFQTDGWSCARLLQWRSERCWEANAARCSQAGGKIGNCPTAGRAMMDAHCRATAA